MCGIVGYIGDSTARSILMDGLNKLEYRGYDSAGIALYNQGQVEVYKQVGKLENLEQVITDEKPQGTVGVGHTRWATHGRPSVPNSHPHTGCDDDFVVVHNGIIENYLQLKEELQEGEHLFTSETDTEVIVHLIEEEYRGNLESAVRRVVAKLEGSYAFVAMAVQEPQKLVAVRQDSPLIIGLKDQEYFVASDIPAVLKHTKDVYILDDEEMAVVTQNGVELSTVEGETVDKEVFTVDWDPGMAEKSGYEHFMLKEIHEQPEALRRAISGRLSNDNSQVIFDELNLSPAEIEKYEKIYIVACGTAYHSGIVAKYLLEDLVEIPVEVDIASEFRYRDPLLDENTLAIVVSQSGETADTLAALREAKSKGAQVLAIGNVVGSTIPREADQVVYIHAGPEIAVASTKAYINMLMVFYLLSIYFAQLKGTISATRTEELIQALKNLPNQVAQLIKDSEDTIAKLADSYVDQNSAFFIGRGVDYAIALEGALKLKEISYIYAEAYAAGELKHGTLALIEEDVPVIAIATQESIMDKMFSNIQEVQAREAHVTGVVLAGNEEVTRSLDRVIEIPSTEEILTSILTVVPLQLLAYYVALKRGCDIDQPRNLAKSVTVE
ncbi:glutamine--fructose-6-phosphate transaminase (isomerizing) [Fuchsiella alkaliacetigena]|uniref:glutamine--fructose-6-phosphate transaminase (isomerizing) n=1 Tax=Fuchsiella alkaliacetigena TaxID=957042 RepID=UPI00200B9734|nr:glutamine--fructose-6-phosphate transaminase (isomerizing) [Fuchsiella alkaliacetigena]MCK8824151.1 glutamine--fructose-6-phosphate transaminase (isomerizing) [Fuchsiella alkaliacetigena]